MTVPFTAVCGPPRYRPAAESISKVIVSVGWTPLTLNTKRLPGLASQRRHHQLHRRGGRDHQDQSRGDTVRVHDVIALHDDGDRHPEQVRDRRQGIATTDPIGHRRPGRRCFVGLVSLLVDVVVDAVATGTSWAAAHTAGAERARPQSIRAVRRHTCIATLPATDLLRPMSLVLPVRYPSYRVIRSHHLQRHEISRVSTRRRVAEPACGACPSRHGKHVMALNGADVSDPMLATARGAATVEETFVLASVAAASSAIGAASLDWLVCSPRT